MIKYICEGLPEADMALFFEFLGKKKTKKIRYNPLVYFLAQYHPIGFTRNNKIFNQFQGATCPPILEAIPS